MIDPRTASGLRDLGPSVAVPRERLTTTFRAVFASFGFTPIETPHIERMDVLTGKGAGSDEVLRQIFEVVNKGGERGELALRFDLTVPLARFISKHIDELGVPFKRYAIGSVFRGERPAKGRFREFVQCDFDILGTESALADAETAHVIHDSLAAAGIPEFTISINNRRILDGFLESIAAGGRSAAVLRSLDKLAKIGREGVRDELTGRRRRKENDSADDSADDEKASQPRIDASTSDKNEQAFTEPRAEIAEEPPLNLDQADRLLDFVEAGKGRYDALDYLAAIVKDYPTAVAGIENLRTILNLLDSVGVPERRVRVDSALARGLDYYTGVVFETTVNGWERFGSVSSGGRYDNLAGLFTSRRIPGVGASIGLDRLTALMDEAGLLKDRANAGGVLVVQFPGVDPRVSASIAARLRRIGIAAEVYPDPIAMGKQLGYGSARGRAFAVIVGPDEAAKRTFNLRDLGTRKERKDLPLDRLEDEAIAAIGITK
jgi:histidyl-tRNA synthetase